MKLFEMTNWDKWNEDDFEAGMEVEVRKALLT
jgi:hypothetical protein